LGKLDRFSAVLPVIIERSATTTFVETGTFHGESLAYATSLPFAQLHSIELSHALHEDARIAFAHDARVHPHHGDSATVLPAVLADVRDRCLLWLDAHYCFLDSARGPKDCSLLEELDAVLAHEQRLGTQHVIVIDDHHILGTGPDDPWLVGEDVVFVPEADWREVTVERVRGLFDQARQIRVWGDAMFVFPSGLDIADLHGPADPFAGAEQLDR
jgi:hypothetical protein